MKTSTQSIASEIVKSACIILAGNGVKAPGGFGAVVDALGGDNFRLTLLAHGDGLHRSRDMMNSVRDVSLILAEMMGAQCLRSAGDLRSSLVESVARSAANDQVEIYEFRFDAVELVDQCA